MAIRHRTTFYLLLTFGGMLMFSVVAALWLAGNSRPPLTAAAVPQLAGDPNPLKDVYARQDREFQVWRARHCIGHEGIISLAVERFRLRQGRFPNHLNDLLAEPADLPPGETWAGPFLNHEELLVDPWGNRYEYRNPGSHNNSSYDLWSTGPDRTDQTTDDITNW